MAARLFDIPVLFDEPDMLFNGYYTWEVYSDSYQAKSTSYEDQTDKKNTTYANASQEQEFYGG